MSDIGRSPFLLFSIITFWCAFAKPDQGQSSQNVATRTPEDLNKPTLIDWATYTALDRLKEQNDQGTQQVDDENAANDGEDQEVGVEISELIADYNALLRSQIGARKQFRREIQQWLARGRNKQLP